MRAAGHQRAQGVGDLDLAAMAAHRLDARIERRVAAVGRIDRQRAGDERRRITRSVANSAGERERRSRPACR